MDREIEVQEKLKYVIVPMPMRRVGEYSGPTVAWAAEINRLANQGYRVIQTIQAADLGQFYVGPAVIMELTK